MSPSWETFSMFWYDALYSAVSDGPEKAEDASLWLEKFAEGIADSKAQKRILKLIRFLRHAYTMKTGLFPRRLLTQRQREERLDILALNVSASLQGVR